MDSMQQEKLKNRKSRREITHCKYCGRVVPKTSWIKNEEISNGLFKTIFWCKTCQKDFTIEHQKQEGYSVTQDGYILVKIPGIGYVREHIYVWEKAHGKLPPGSIVHHINRIKDDNRLENLIAMPKTSHHAYL